MWESTLLRAYAWRRLTHGETCDSKKLSSYAPEFMPGVMSDRQTMVILYIFMIFYELNHGIPSIHVIHSSLQH